MRHDFEVARRARGLGWILLFLILSAVPVSARAKDADVSERRALFQKFTKCGRLPVQTSEQVRAAVACARPTVSRARSDYEIQVIMTYFKAPFRATSGHECSTADVKRVRSNEKNLAARVLCFDFYDDAKNKRLGIVVFARESSRFVIEDINIP